ncbi:TPA: hypothetical protein ACGXMA_003626 [Bacillus cereus]|uniref:hypothetical protein n=1 Tax=Bacillus thuringiensis TaxID=1428 RepID=UPI0000E8A257|nr:hypothetical protein [Bacillus thuringiensis]HDR4732329.1 hypothetical protein [Bacillus cereus]ABK87358.1 hypothetical protein BALH_4149 [Bacillus thuringiensis str. Al Hakam]AJH68585.1 hypothetical protein BF32_2165 [Bacillus thuringiensis]QKH33176.1 hypothetical protein FOC87_26975 [Bacillus thuringiensis]QKQ39318.1 hypothetical protein FOC85_08165 [Bacillus thuringiensis]
MKNLLKLLLSIVLLISTGGLFATTSKGETQTEEFLITEDNSEKIEFDDLSAEQKQAFIADGYNENDEFFVSSFVQGNQANLANDGLQAGLARINVITVTGATKKKTNTSATTTTHITSSLKPILKANIQITPNGAKKVAYSVTPNKKSVSTSKTWHYTGKKKYIAVKTAVQVTTSMGVSPNGSSVGGVTLGK